MAPREASEAAEKIVHAAAAGPSAVLRERAIIAFAFHK